MNDFENLFKKRGYKKIEQDKIYVDRYVVVEKKSSTAKTVAKKNNRNFVVPKSEHKELYDYDEDLLRNSRIAKSSSCVDIILNDASRLDKKVALFLSQDRVNYDAVLDLHGLKIQEAFELFRKFIKCNFVLNKRLLLVITGFGNPDNSETLRSNLMKWVNGGNDLRKIILYIGFAQARDGGQGAFCCYLRSY